MVAVLKYSAMAEPSPSLLQVELCIKNDQILSLEAGGRATVRQWLEINVAD